YVIDNIVAIKDRTQFLFRWESSQTSMVKCRKSNVDNVKGRHHEIQRKEADDEKIKLEHE
ncbi:unnamed protein product, partial [Didymodactylos carnosus]